MGDLVFLKLKQHKMQSIATRISPKLNACYYGPFEVVGRIGEVAYKLKLPPSSKVHPVFHVSLLKKAQGKYHALAELPTGLEDDDVEKFEPESVLAVRIIVKRGEKINNGWSSGRTRQ